MKTMKRAILATIALTLVLSTTAVSAQRGRGRGGGFGVPEAPAGMLGVANDVAAAINGQDTQGLQGMLAPDAVYLDEDGHALPAAIWAMRLTSADSPKEIAITGTHGQEWDDGGWVSFNYTLDEVSGGEAVTLRGTASIVVRGSAGAWRIVLVHGALEQTVAGLLD